jgi:hypothetical protein
MESILSVFLHCFPTKSLVFYMFSQKPLQLHYFLRLDAMRTCKTDFVLVFR